MAINTFSLLRNTSDENRKIHTYAWFGAFFPLSLAIIVGNSIALAVFLRKTFRVKKSNYLLVNLTLADLLVGVSYAILSLMSVLASYDIFSTDINRHGNLAIETTFLLLSVNASIYTLAVISVERVLAVFWPFHHRLAKRWHYLTAIGLVWILSLLPILKYTFPHINWWHYFFYYCLLMTVLIIIFISYLSIWIKMKFFTKFRHCRTIQENSKLTKTLFIVTVVSLGTWLPETIWESVATLQEIPETKVNGMLHSILPLLVISNSFWNVIVYSVRMPEFRRELRLVLCKYL
ncbi:galanin receptor type 2-like [Actinia tenebrosa]|uniref:Galanin receptor type 2-like n=1 Tax=Actinia tenebrosa TaxID=6105 RepID=A0A6P8HZ91_ACTTE|nr:galanin receptor type 2-like [Actinia tenebrosa]